MKAKYLLAVILALQAFGCDIAAMVQARNDMMQAKSAYTQCLQEHSAEPGECAGLNEAYEADLQAVDLQAYQATRF